VEKSYRGGMMNNIEIKKLKGLKAGMTDKQINELKSGKKTFKPKKMEKAPQEDVIEQLDEILLVNLNLVKDEDDDRDFPLQSTFKAYDLPNYIDWSGKMSPVKNQGGLGSCVGFATAAMKEFQEQMEHEKEVAEGKAYTREQDSYDLSEAWIYWNCKKIDSWPDSEGTSIRVAMKVLQKIGVPCEKAYPYSDIYKGSPETWAKMIAKWGLIDSYYRCNNLQELKAGLVNGPVVLGIGCFREIFSVGTNGVVPYPANPNEMLGGHAICAVGFNDDRQLVKFKNSWGTTWGKDGYGYLPYRYIDDFMWDAWIAKDLQVTKEIFNERAKDELV
jgi:C1A family cysteine protease